MLHHLVAELARQAVEGRLPTERDVERVVARLFYLPLAGPVPPARLRETARRRLSAYVRGHAPELARALKVEASFEVPLAAARIRGRVDLLLRADGAGRPDARQGVGGPVGAASHGRPVPVELIDFKTFANHPPSEIHANQLRLYAEALERLGYEPVRMAIHDLDGEHGARSEVPRDERARRAFRDRLEEWVDGLRSGRYPPASDAATCRACDFRTFCPDSRARGSAAVKGGLSEAFFDVAPLPATHPLRGGAEPTPPRGTGATVAPPGCRAVCHPGVRSFDVPPYPRAAGQEQPESGSPRRPDPW